MGFKKYGLLASLILAAIFLVCQPRAEAEPKYLGVEVGDTAPDFSLKSIDGQTVRLSSLRGKKVVALDFWATWCSACLEELPKLNKAYSMYRDKGFEVLSIVLNPGDLDEIHRVKKEQKIEFPILLDSNWDVANLYGLEGPVPVVLVIDGKGVIRFTHFGNFAPGKNEIPRVVEALLTEL